MGAWWRVGSAGLVATAAAIATTRRGGGGRHVRLGIRAGGDDGGDAGDTAEARRRWEVRGSLHLSMLIIQTCLRTRTQNPSHCRVVVCRARAVMVAMQARGCAIRSCRRQLASHGDSHRRSLNRLCWRRQVFCFVAACSFTKTKHNRKKAFCSGTPARGDH